MKKRGFLLGEETLKIIIAVIAIGFLVYFLAALYFANQASKEFEQAKETLNFVISEAKAGRTAADIYNPKDWWLLSRGEELCICEESSSESCTEKGFCTANEGFSLESAIKFEDLPMTLNIDQINKKIIK